MRMLQYFQKLFLPTKSWKKSPSKVAQKNSNLLFFPYCTELPKLPKQKNSCSKMWLIDQLYIELGTESFSGLWIFSKNASWLHHFSFPCIPSIKLLSKVIAAKDEFKFKRLLQNQHKRCLINIDWMQKTFYF